MDAIKFIKERERMCRFYKHASDCYQCHAKEYECSPLEVMVDDDNIVTIVEEWAAEHPRKTRQSVFLEQWPDTQLDKKGNVIICPKQLCRGEEFNKLIAACRGTNCYECRRKFWGKVVQ